jgi:hypothetical protein
MSGKDEGQEPGYCTDKHRPLPYGHSVSRLLDQPLSLLIS